MSVSESVWINAGKRKLNFLANSPFGALSSYQRNSVITDSAAFFIFCPCPYPLIPVHVLSLFLYMLRTSGWCSMQLSCVLFSLPNAIELLFIRPLNCTVFGWPLFWSKVYCFMIYSGLILVRHCACYADFEGNHIIWWVMINSATSSTMHLWPQHFFQVHHHTLWAPCSTIDSAWHHGQLIHKNEAYKKLWKRQTPFDCCSINIRVDIKCSLIQRELAEPGPKHIWTVKCISRNPYARKYFPPNREVHLLYPANVTA